MENILEGNYKIFSGLYTALARTKSSAQTVYLKVLEAQKQFFINGSGHQFSEEQILTIELLDNALIKFYLGSYTLEQLWGVHNYLEIADHGRGGTSERLRRQRRLRLGHAPARLGAGETRQRRHPLRRRVLRLRRILLAPGRPLVCLA